jgi:signal peptidase II
MTRNLSWAFVTLLGCVASDQATKMVAIETLKGKPTTSYWIDTVRLTYLENRGAFLSLGAEWPDWLRWLVFSAMSSVLVLGALAVVVLRARQAGGLGWKGPSWGPLLVAAGGIGNLIDRFARDGAVVDFLNVGLGSLRTGVFNVADVQIMLGMVLWVFWPAPTVGNARSPEPSRR